MQFSPVQVEMFVICTPEQSDAMHDELVALERQLYSELGLHFKVPVSLPPHLPISAPLTAAPRSGPLSPACITATCTSLTLL